MECEKEEILQNFAQQQHTNDLLIKKPQEIEIKNREQSKELELNKEQEIKILNELSLLK